MKPLPSATAAMAILALPLPAPAQVDWSPLPPFLPNREHHAMAFDSGRGCLVVFGGYNESVFLDDTWEFDGTRWTEVVALPAARPSARRGATLVYDAARGRSVLFGGQRPDGTVLDETWEWDGTTWLRLSPATSPPPRFRHACTYDSVRQRVVLYGGELGRTRLDDTWEWDGTTWTRAAPVASPGPRMMHAMAFDEARGRVVLFGGSTTSVVSASDTWEWDGSTWRQRFSATTPPGRLGHGMAYDALRARVVMYEGAYAWDRGVWEWDGNDWAQALPPRNEPDPGTRLRHALAWDSARQRIVLFGGWAGLHVNGATSDLWQWDGQTWTVVYEGAPPARNAGGAAYDPDRDRGVLFGGELGTQTKVGDTWEWNGAAWSLRAPRRQAPLARSHHALAFDPVRRRVLMYGGITPPSRHLNDTWEWDGTVWRRLLPESSPPPRQRHAMVTTDPVGEPILLFAGARIDPVTGTVLNTFQDTWAWDGATWVALSPPGVPPARYGHAMAYDAARSRVVLFGGTDGAGALLADTWEWDGNAWLPRTTMTTPPARTAHAMVYDAPRRRVVLFGGMDAVGPSSDVWEWDGTDWRLRATATAPRPRSGHVLWFDTVRESMVTYGGLSLFPPAGYLRSDLWAFGPTYRASVNGFGSGCAGSSGVPTLDSAGLRPWLGDPLPIRLSSLPPGRAAFLVLGGSRAYWPGGWLPFELGSFGMPGCWLRVSPDVVIPVANPSGSATLVLSIPPATGLLGLRFVAQGFAQDPPVNPSGAITSAGLEAVIGGR